MFEHHKYCVVEASGVLLGYRNENNLLQMYVLDADNGVQADFLNNSFNDRAVFEESFVAYPGEKIKITDPMFVEFIYQNMSAMEHSFIRYLLDVRVTSTVSIDGDEVQFPQVSRAFLKDSLQTLIYES